MSYPDTSRVRRESLRISSIDRPGWHVEPGRIPDPGDRVCCLDGLADVVRILGRTSDGGRLLELRCESRPQPFFASSANILFGSDEEALGASPAPSETVGSE